MSPAIVASVSIKRKTSDIDHAIAEFAQGVQFMAEIKDGTEPQKAGEIGELVAALTKELQQHARSRPHGIVYANLALILACIFWSGVLFQRVNDLDARMRSLANADAISSKLTDLTEQQNQMRRDLESMRERIDRFLDKR